MPYGAPVAVGMTVVQPEQEVLALNGHGDFLMNGQEFATAVQYRLPIIALVFDNAILGTIRMHQERDYPGRVSATDLVNPDFAAMARSFGGFGATVEKTADFAPAFQAAEESGFVAILYVNFDVDVINPNTNLSAILTKALNS
jgi:acetolactate synthase-1/2/3 large subunit